MSAAILCEQVELIENTINRDSREVEVVLIRPGWSANGRYYPPAVLAKAAALYENSRAFANHPTPEQVRRGESRDVRDLSGRYYNVRVGEAGELRGTRKVYDNPTGNAVWPLIVDATESRQPVIGLSINAVGKTATGKDPDGKEGMIVEEITAVHSVDDVINPAAGGGFERLVADSNVLAQEVVNAMTYEEFIAARPDFVETIREQQKRVRQDEAVRAAYEARDQAQAALVEAKERIVTLEQLIEDHRAAHDQQARAAALDTALNDATIPPLWKADLRAQLESAPADQWTAIIDREKRKAAAIQSTQPVPVTGAPVQQAQPVRVIEHQAAVLDMEKIDTPEKLKRELEIRGI
jgi:hypothetical protein